MTQKQTYVNWLNTAYAMEIDIRKTLEGQLDDAKDYPEVESKIREHLEVTKGHAEKVKACIERNDSTVSSIKLGMASMMGMMKGASTELAQDKVLKDMKADYATEHFEMIAYKGLIETAQLVGDTESVSVFENIIKDEEQMAQSITQLLPSVTIKYLQQQK